MSFEIKVTSNLGDVSVATENERGHSAEYLAQRCADKICGISENSTPEVRQQAEAFKVAIYNTILYYMKQAITSDRTTVTGLLKRQGHNDLAKILMEL